MADAKISIPKMNIQSVKFDIEGMSPLVVHRWSEKARKEILDKQMKKAKGGKEAKDPYKQFVQSLYFISGRPHDGGEIPDDARFGFPAVAFKKALVSACRQVDGIAMTEARQVLFVKADSFSDCGVELVEIQGEVVMREDMVRIGNNIADIRFRGSFPQWETTLDIEFDAGILSAEMVANLCNIAGWSVGVGEDRPEKKGGQWGRFRIG